MDEEQPQACGSVDESVDEPERLTVPKLVGPSNLEQWDHALRAFLAADPSQLDHLTHIRNTNRCEDISRIGHRAWNLTQDSVVETIMDSLTKALRKKLLAVGWEPDIDFPRYHYNFIMREVPRMRKPPKKAKDEGKDVMPSFKKARSVIQELKRLNKKPSELYCSPQRSCLTA